MYPAPEMNALAARKAALRRAIGLRRTECGAAAARVLRPLAGVHRVLDFWRQLPLLAKVASGPLGLLLLRTVIGRRRTVRTLLRWSPLVAAAARGLRSTGPVRRRPRD